MKTFILQLLTLVSIVISSPLCLAQEEMKNMANRYLQNYYANTSEMKVYIHTDKYLYESGENVWITALACDRYSLKPLERNERIQVKLFSSKGMEVAQASMLLENGTGRGVLNLREYIDEGKYTLIAYSKNSWKVFRQDLVVKQHVIPHFLVSVNFQDKFYVGGEKVVMNLTATDYFKNPVKGVSYLCELKNGDAYMLIDKGRLDKAGQASLALNLPNPIPKDGVGLKFTVQNKVVSEQVSVPIPTQSEDVSVFFYPEGGSYVKGIPGTMVIKAYDDSGKDFPFAGIVFNDNEEKMGTVTSDKSGTAKFDYDASTKDKLKLQITSPYAINKIFDFPEPKGTGMVLSIKDITDGEIKLVANQFPQGHTTCYLGIVNKGELYKIEKFTLKDHFDITLPLDALREGINRFTLFNQKMEPVSESSAYITQQNGNQVEIEFEQKTYKNREKVVLTTHNNDNLLYAFSAVDEYRLSLDLNNLPSHLHVGTELEGFPVLRPSDLSENSTPDSRINELLKYTPPADKWNDIYASNNKKSDYQPLSTISKKALNDGLLSYSQKLDDLLVFTNFSHTNYYLANNPVLAEKLKEMRKVKKEEPFYKKQLRSGVALREVIRNMKQYNIMDGKIVFPGSINSLKFQGGALIVLDGVRLGESISVLDQINPFDIEEIFISTNPNDILTYTGLNSVGIIDITTKHGGDEAAKDEEFDEKFESPDYSKIKGDGNDLRTTIFYLPFQPKATPQGNISFYHSDIRTNVIGRLEGVDENGNTVYRETRYSSFNYSEENQ